MARPSMTPLCSLGVPSAARLSSRIALVLVCIALLAAIPGRAGAQVEPIDARWMTVTRDTPMRCGELATFYKVADLESGAVIRVDALSPRWARLVYPPGQHAFVATRDAADVSGGSLTLTPSARVRAPNAISGLTGSWRSLYLGDIAPGVRLKILGEAQAADGQVVGYRIEPPKPPVAPHEPWGYVELSALRDSTEAEVAAYLEALATIESGVETPGGVAGDSGDEPEAAGGAPTTEPEPLLGSPVDGDEDSNQATGDTPGEASEPDSGGETSGASVADAAGEDHGARDRTPDTTLLEE